MKLIFKELKQGIVKLKTDSLDDVWYLSQLIEPGDVVKSKTERKIKVGSSERSSSVIKKTVTLSLNVEKVEFHKYSSTLRVSGKIIEEHEDIPKGSYHTFDVDDNTILTIEKPQWLKYQLDKLHDALENKAANIIICVVDRDEATFALLKKYGYEILSELKGEVEKKYVSEKTKSNFYREIVDQLTAYDQRFHCEKMIIGSIPFWKEYLAKELEKETLKSKVIFATCSSSGKNAIDEVLKRPEISTALKEDRIIQETNLVEDLLVAIKKQELAAYGINDVEHVTNMGAVKCLLVTDAFIQQTRQKNIFARVDRIMKLVDSMNGEVYIISSEHDGGKKLDGLGGIGALLRYKV